jgi:hypothetical protein
VNGTSVVEFVEPGPLRRRGRGLAPPETAAAAQGLDVANDSEMAALVKFFSVLLAWDAERSRMSTRIASGRMGVGCPANG